MRRPNGNVQRALLLFLAMGSAGCGSSPSEKGNIPLDPDRFVSVDSVRIMTELRVLAHDSMEGRRTGEPGNEKARAYIAAAFLEAGLETPPAGLIQPFEFQARGDTTRVVHGANVVGYVPGTDPELGAMVLTAHFDHLGIRNGEVFNGADDNASGTVGIMSLARYVSAHPLHHTVVFAALDAEEMGLRGARAFVDAGWPSPMVLNVNLDMIAHSDSLLFAAGTYHYPELRPILESVDQRPPVVLAFGHDEPGVEGVQDWTDSSDHGPFHDRNIPFIYFGVEDHPDYHRATDEVETIDPGFFINAIRTVLAAVRTLDTGLADGNGAHGG